MNHNFENFNLNKPILEKLEELNFKHPTKIQKEALPYVIDNKDVIVSAKTGSGKTLIYALRIAEKVNRGYGVQAVVLVPTRELAVQVGEVLKQLTANKKLKIMISYGGGSLKAQKEEIQNMDIIVGTPGRISDYVEQDLFQLGKIKVLVLDEVDSLVQKQFQTELNYILETMPKKRQTLVFSATIPKDVHNIIKNYMYFPKRVSVDNYVNFDKLKQFFYEVETDKKLSLLSYLLSNERAGLSIVFVNRQDAAEFISHNLKHTGLDIRTIHGETTQGKRNKVIKDFQDEKFDVLIATDLAARGLDVENISHIYNYNIPKHIEKYIHRIGRTARAGKEGKVINFISKQDVKPFLEIINEHKIQVLPKELPNFQEVQIKKEYKQKKHRR